MICYPETASGSDISLDSRTIITNILEVLIIFEYVGFEDELIDAKDLFYIYFKY